MVPSLDLGQGSPVDAYRSLPSRPWVCRGEIRRAWEAHIGLYKNKALATLLQSIYISARKK